MTRNTLLGAAYWILVERRRGNVVLFDRRDYEI